MQAYHRLSEKLHDGSGESAVLEAMAAIAQQLAQSPMNDSLRAAATAFAQVTETVDDMVISKVEETQGTTPAVSKREEESRSLSLVEYFGGEVR